jgi:hypothetical protein
MNEILQWAQQSKNLENQQKQLTQSTLVQPEVTLSQNEASLSDLQSNFVLVNVTILLFYVVIFLVNKKADRALTLLAFFVSVVVAFTPLYDLLSGMQYHFIFAVIYFSLVFSTKQTPIKVAVLLMGFFQALMAWDSLVNATIETFIYTHYEITICLLHSIVIGYFLKSDFIRIKQYIKRIVHNSVMFVRN